MSEAVSSGRTSNSTRWLQLIVGIICMSMIANLQYGWTLFVAPIDAKFGWGRPAIQVAFAIFVLTETWLVPIEGWFVDRFGPRIVVVIGGVLCGISWALNSVVDSLFLLYVSAAIGGIGAGAVYGTCVGNALKWFPDRRGLAAGLTAAGFGAGSALTIIPISNMIKASGYQATFLAFGIGQGLVVFALAWILRAPQRDEVAAPAQIRTHLRQSDRDYEWTQVLRSPIFWVMYVMFVLVGTGGLMVTANLAPIAKDLTVDAIPVSLIGITLPALIFALSLDRILNGVTRPFFGWVSDNIGRENTMFIAFGMEAIGIWLFSMFGQNPVLFVLLSGLTFFFWGEIYSLFPSTCTDVFGSKFATVNAGLLYTAKGTASLLVPLGNVLQQYTGSWHAVLIIAAVMNGVAALMAIAVLKPMRAAHHSAVRDRLSAASR